MKDETLKIVVHSLQKSDMRALDVKPRKLAEWNDMS